MLLRHLESHVKVIDNQKMLAYQILSTLLPVIKLKKKYKLLKPLLILKICITACS